MRMLGARLVLALLVGFPFLVLRSSAARALSFQADFTTTSYQVVAGDTYADLLAEHLAGTPLASVSLTALENVSAQVEAGVGTNYSIRLTAVLDVAVTGLYAFQVGTDWGRGGVAAVIDSSTGSVIDELVRTDDLWWANDWANADVFTTQRTLAAGTSYTFVWIGFEDCCGGASTIRFSVDGAPLVPLSQANVAPFVVPEPASALLAALGLALLARRRGRSSLRPTHP